MEDIKGRIGFRKYVLPWLANAVSPDALRYVLEALRVGIKRSEDVMERAGKSGDREWAEVATDSECEVIEGLLGLIFIACQVQITQLVSRCVKAQTLFLPKQEHLQKEDLLHLGGPWRCGSMRSKVRIVDAAANYFKHREEWANTWDELKGKNRATADVIREVGAEPNSTGNMRTIAEAIGITGYADLRSLYDTISAWKKRVIDRMKKLLAL